MPIPPVANLVIGTLDPTRRAQLDACVSAQNLQPRNYRGLLLAWYHPTVPGHRLHVVRASEKFCAPFYGTHDFAYYLIDESSNGGRTSFRLVLQNRGDRLSVLPTVSNGLNDIQTAGCDTHGCRIARMAFDGRSYRPVQCEATEIRGKTEVRRPRRCGSDSGRDDQLAGAPAPLAPSRRSVAP